MTANHRRLKEITLTLGGVSYECQATSAMSKNNTPDGDRVYTLCPTGSFIEDSDPDWALEIEYIADWTASGISRALEAADQTAIAAIVTWNTDALGTWARRETGNVFVKSPDRGGKRGDTDTGTATLRWVDKPVITYP